MIELDSLFLSIYGFSPDHDSSGHKNHIQNITTFLESRVGKDAFSIEGKTVKSSNISKKYSKIFHIWNLNVGSTLSTVNFLDLVNRIFSQKISAQYLTKYLARICTFEDIGTFKKGIPKGRKGKLPNVYTIHAPISYALFQDILEDIRREDAAYFKTRKPSTKKATPKTTPQELEQYQNIIFKPEVFQLVDGGWVTVIPKDEAIRINNVFGRLLNKHDELKKSNATLMDEINEISSKLRITDAALRDMKAKELKVSSLTESLDNIEEKI
jgi:energy-converting hydrogenase A subunit M